MSVYKHKKTFGHLGKHAVLESEGYEDSCLCVCVCVGGGEDGLCIGRLGGCCVKNMITFLIFKSTLNFTF